MTKKLLLTCLVLLLVAGTLFAEGTQEGCGCGDSQEQKVTLSGNLILAENKWPQLESGGQVYVLMLPPHVYNSIEVENGEIIQVEGYVTADHPWAQDKENNYLVVLNATIRGKEYIIVHPQSHRGGMGGHGRHGSFMHPH